MKSVRQGHLHYSGGAVAVCRNLARSYNKYQGKNPLIIVDRGSAPSLQNVHTIQRMTIAEVIALESRYRPAQQSSQQTPSASSEVLTSQEDIEKVKKIQLWWRSRQYLQQLLMKSVKGWQLARFKTLMAVCPTMILRSALRFFFISRGFGTLCELARARDRLASTHTSIMTALEEMTEASAYEELGRALTTSADIERSVDAVAETISDAELKTMIEDRQFSKFRLRFDEVDVVIKKAHQGFEEIDMVLKEAHKAGGL